MHVCIQVLMSISHEDKEELARLRQEALAGRFKTKLQALEKLLVGRGVGREGAEGQGLRGRG
jgi:hypothetical protein